MEKTAKEILYDELSDSMVEEIEGTLMEEWILQAMEEYHQAKLKNHGVIGDVSNFFHCQEDEEENVICQVQCDHCKEYYKGTDNGC